MTARRIAAVAVAVTFAGCGSGTRTPPQPALTPPVAPPPKDDVYAAAGANMLGPAVARDRALVYVPNTLDNTVTVVSQTTRRVVGRFRTGAQPQHVTPSWDMRTLYVDNDLGNSLTPIDPRTGRPRARPIRVPDPYNLYFTPDGRYAIVVAEARRRLEFRDARTLAPRFSIAARCSGVDHMDFSAYGRYAFVSCEYDGTMLKLDLRRRRFVRRLRLHGGRASPQDVKLSPDGRVIWVADQTAGGVWLISARRFRILGLLHTGAGAHGLYVSRDARVLYVSNRAAGTVSLVALRRRRVVATWRIPGSASPDMGGVSADGRTLWLSGRYDAVLYALDAQSGRLLARIKVGRGPHGACVWPQPGRFSLGHTGVTR